MVQSAAALWLNESLGGFDHLFLSIQHFFGRYLGFLLTPLMKFVTFMGEKGWVFFVLALIFMLMADRRDLGVCIFGAVCCGALITNIILKDSVARLRPFEALDEYTAWWNAVGSPAEDGFSFPSGHVTACAAGMTAITLMRGKKWLAPSAIIVLVMAISRNYLMAHYPTDVIAAAVIGVFSGVVAWFITQFIFRFLNRRRKTMPVCGLILDFDIRDVLPFKLPDLSGLIARLPALPFGKGAKKDGASVRRAAKPAGRHEPERDPMDDDVKTWPGSGTKKAAAAENPAAAEKADVTGEAAASAEKPARRTVAARPLGRHEKPESADAAGSAKKAPRFTRPGSYQGKH